jgi:methyl-accepting chemotaxis protein
VNALEKTADEELVELATAYSTYIEGELIKAQTIMDGIANRNAIKSWDWAQQKKALKYEIARNDNFAEMFIVDKEANARATNETTAKVSGREYFKQAMKGKTYFNDLVYCKVTDRLEFFVTAPIKGSQVEGLVGAYVNAEYLSNSIKNIKVKSTGSAFIVNDKGTTIAHPDMEVVNRQENIIELAKEDKELKQLASVIKRMISGDSHAEKYTYKGEKYYCGYHPIGDTGWSMAVRVKEKELLKDVFEFRKNLIIMIIVGIILSIIITYYTGNNIVHPISLAIKHAITMSKLDYTTKVPDKFMNAKDEIGELGRAFNIISENTKNIIRDTQRYSSQLLNSSTQLSNTINDNVETAEEVAKAIEGIAVGAASQAQEAESGVIELSKLGELITESHNIATEVNNSSDNVKKVTLNGKDTVVKLKKEFGLNIEISDQLKNNTQELSEQSKSIVNILNTISNIANQTNLLALNASIEAARAGEAGRGFAVVAEEIRKLAEESENATADISNILGAMTNKIKIANENMDKAGEIVGNVDIYLEETVYSYDDIESSMINLIQQFKKLVDALEQIDMNKAKTFTVIESISAISEQSAASTEEVSASVEEQTVSMEEMANSSEELAEIANKMKDIINKFII